MQICAFPTSPITRGLAGRGQAYHSEGPDMYNGRDRRLDRLMGNCERRLLLLPFDDSLLSGPEGGLRNIGVTLQGCLSAGVDAIMTFRGLAMQHGALVGSRGLIINLTASTMRGCHTRKVLVSTVEDAVQLGADCVAVHVNIGSQYEPEMLAIMGDVSRECRKFGMPLMGIMYPRTEGVDGDNNYDTIRLEDPLQYAEMVRHATRVGVELGADIIKTQFTGDAESFATVVESSMQVPVLIAGGKIMPDDAVLELAKQAMLAGASGVSFGRNVFNRQNPVAMVQALRMIVHAEANIGEADSIPGS